MVAAHAEEGLQELIQEKLYGVEGPDGLVPGPISDQIALIKAIWGDRVRILTTNYDHLIETALRARADWPARNVRSYVRNVGEPPGVASVTHLHGQLVPGHPPGRVVLSEEEYHLMQDAWIWQENLVGPLLAKSVCLFVGSSLTDPNLIRYLYRYGRSGDHLAIFVRQAEPFYSQPVRTALEGSATARWGRCGVQPLFANYFSEVAQFLHECAQRRAKGAGYWGYATRQRVWHGAIARLMRGKNGTFAERQQELSNILGLMVDEVPRIGQAHQVPLKKERLGIALWIANYQRQTLELWATSDRLYREPVVKTVRLELSSEWVAVESATRGTSVARDPHVYASRWRYVRGVPFFLNLGGRGRLFGGVVTLASTSPNSRLANAPAGFLDSVDLFLSGVMAEMLSG